MTARTAILATGGMDSTVLLYRAARAGRQPQAVTVDYGQAVFRTQVEYIARHTAKLGLPEAVQIKIPTHPWQRTPGLFTDGYAGPEKEEHFGGWDRLYHWETFVEGRNAAMLVYALAWCSANRFEELWAGYYYEPGEWLHSRSFKLVTCDTSPQFVDAVNTLAAMGFSSHVRFRAPFYEERADRPDIVAEGRRLGIDLRNDTYSCHFHPACGRCMNCVMKERDLK